MNPRDQNLVTIDSNAEGAAAMRMDERERMTLTSSKTNRASNKFEMISAGSKFKGQQRNDSVRSNPKQEKFSSHTLQQASSLESQIHGLFVPPEARKALFGSIRSGLNELNSSMSARGLKSGK